MIKHQFGGKIREVREKKGITMKEVARQVGISESMVSQIERNKVSPSIDTLLTLTEILGIDMDYLFKDYRKKPGALVVKKEERKTLQTGAVKYQQLSVLSDSREEEHAIEAFLLEIAPAGEKGSKEYGHTGRELGFIMSGQGRFELGTEEYNLEAGDTVSFASDSPHVLQNTGKEPLTALWIITPPRMLFFKE